MESIFESLENLNVSEECFDEIMGIVEDLLSEDIKSYAQKKAEEAGNKENKYIKRLQKVVSAKKENGSLPDKKFADKLFPKLFANKYRQEKDKYEKLSKKAERLPEPTERPTKNEIGAEKTTSRKYPKVTKVSPEYDVEWGGDYPTYTTRINKKTGDEVILEPKSDKQRIKDSIARHNKKNK